MSRVFIRRISIGHPFPKAVVRNALANIWTCTAYGTLLGQYALLMAHDIPKLAKTPWLLAWLLISGGASVIVLLIAWFRADMRHVALRVRYYMDTGEQP